MRYGRPRTKSTRPSSNLIRELLGPLFVGSYWIFGENALQDGRLNVGRGLAKYLSEPLTSGSLVLVRVDVQVQVGVEVCMRAVAEICEVAAFDADVFIYQLLDLGILQSNLLPHRRFGRVQRNGNEPNVASYFGERSSNLGVGTLILFGLV